MKRLEDKVAVVTGGNSGIGLATAKRLQEEGARLTIVGRNAQTLQEAAQSIGNGVLAVQQMWRNWRTSTGFIKRSRRNSAGLTCCSSMPAWASLLRS